MRHVAVGIFSSPCYLFSSLGMPFFSHLGFKIAHPLARHPREGGDLIVNSDAFLQETYLALLGNICWFFIIVFQNDVLSLSFS